MGPKVGNSLKLATVIGAGCFTRCFYRPETSCMRVNGVTRTHRNTEWEPRTFPPRTGSPAPVVSDTDTPFLQPFSMHAPGGLERGPLDCELFAVTQASEFILQGWSFPGGWSPRPPG